MKAVEGFDLTKETRFSTYARICIRSVTITALAAAGVFSPGQVPKEYGYLLRLVRRAEAEAFSFGVPDPTPEELHARICAYGLKTMKDLTVDDVEEALQFLVEYRSGFSLDHPSPVHASGDYLMSEVFGFSSGTEMLVEARERYRLLIQMIERLEQRISHFPAKVAFIVRIRLRLLTDECFTLEELGERFGLTKERIRQIEAKAFKRLSTYMRMDQATLEDLVSQRERLEELLAAHPEQEPWPDLVMRSEPLVESVVPTPLAQPIQLRPAARRVLEAYLRLSRSPNRPDEVLSQLIEDKLSLKVGELRQAVAGQVVARYPLDVLEGLSHMTEAQEREVRRLLAA